MNVYLDDVRKAPIGWMQTRTAAETIETIIDYQGEINTLSLDHDLALVMNVSRRMAEALSSG